MTVKEFSLMSRVNEKRFLVQHEACKCKCRLSESVCDLNQNGVMMNVGVGVRN